MAVPTYDELLAHYDMDNAIMKQTFNDEDLRQFSLTLDMWEKLARFLAVPSPDIANIKSQGDAEEQRIRMLECWKQRCGSMATYEAMVKALLQISRTDLAEKVITLRKASRGIRTLEPTTIPEESSQTAPPSQANSGGIKDTLSSAATSPMFLPATSRECTTQEVTSTLKELEEEFYNLVIYIEDTLENSKVSLNTITRRFRMLPQSIRRQHETDKSYKETRRRVLDSETVKKLFDNLTELKHWNYMTPDTLAHILKDVKINDIHVKVSKYKDKLMVFKANTKLRELINTSFPVPDYCMELTMEVEGWEDKTIQEVEHRAVNIVRRATYSGSPNISLGWKGVIPGSIKVTFFLLEPESANLIPEKLVEDTEVVSVQIDGDIFYSKDYTKVNNTIIITIILDLSSIVTQTTSDNSEVPSRLWHATATIVYNAAGIRDVLIIASKLSNPHPEAVARRPGQLTEEVKLKLQSQGLPPGCQKELDIVKTRWKMDKRYKMLEVHSGESLSRKQIIQRITRLLNTTQNDGGKILNLIVQPLGYRCCHADNTVVFLKI